MDLQLLSIRCQVTIFYFSTVFFTFNGFLYFDENVINTTYKETKWTVKLVKTVEKYSVRLRI